MEIPGIMSPFYYLSVWQPKGTNIVMFASQPRKKAVTVPKQRLQVQPSSWYVIVRSSLPALRALCHVQDVRAEKERKFRWRWQLA